MRNMTPGLLLSEVDFRQKTAPGHTFHEKYVRMTLLILSLREKLLSIR